MEVRTPTSLLVYALRTHPGMLSGPGGGSGVDQECVPPLCDATGGIKYLLPSL